MLSHVIKGLLDELTGLSFAPVHDNMCWYNLTPFQRDVVNIDTLEVRMVLDDFDLLEEYRKKVESIISFSNKPNVLFNGYSLRFKVSGGGILPMPEFNKFESTQYFTLTWYKKGD